MTRKLLLSLALLSTSLSAGAIDSLDWLIADSDLVIRGRVAEVGWKTTPRMGHEDWEEVTITVFETLKGPAPAFGQIAVLRPISEFRTAAWTEETSLFLLVEGRRAAYLKSANLVEGRYLMLDPHARIISLEPRPPNHPSDYAIDQYGRRFVNPLFAADGRRLKDSEDILDAAREIVAEQRNARRRLRPAPIDVGTSVPLTVPADENWKRRAEKQLAQGQLMTWLTSFTPGEVYLHDFDGRPLSQPPDYFKNEQTIDFLWRVLDDPWGEISLTNIYHWPTPIDSFEQSHHANRLWARQILALWDVPVPPPAVNTLLLKRQTISLANPLLLATISLLFLPLLTARRQPLFLRSLTWLTLLLTVATLSLWLRSAFRYDSLIFATTTFEHEISSSYGQLHYLALTGGPPSARPKPRAPSHASTSLIDIEQVPHHLNYLRPDRQWDKAGIALAKGFTPPAVGHNWPTGLTVSYTYRLATVRYPWLVGLFLLLPASRLVNACRRVLRPRRRVRRLHCPNCNYDLRHRPRRCPECGKLTPPFIHE